MAKLSSKSTSVLRSPLHGFFKCEEDLLWNAQWTLVPDDEDSLVTILLLNRVCVCVCVGKSEVRCFQEEGIAGY